MSTLRSYASTSKLKTLVDASRKIKSKEVDQEIELKSKANSSLNLNVLKDSASYRSDRELDLAHFKYLLSKFKVFLF